MKTFWYFFEFESKRFWNVRNSIIVIILFGLALAFVQVGVNEYQDNLERVRKFQQLEKSKVSKYISYRQYGTYGYRTIFSPTQFSILMRNSGVFPDAVSFVDSGERLKIYMPLKGKNIFEVEKSGFSDFAGILLYLGSLLALFYGFDTFKYREYLKFLSSLRSPTAIFGVLMAVRGLILLILHLVLAAFAVGLMALNGFYPQINVFFISFFFVAVGLVLFFFVLGCVFGTAKSRGNALSVLLALWLILLFVIPEAIQSYIRTNAKDIKMVYQLESEKLDLVMKFEKRALEKGGRFKHRENVGDIRKKIIVDYWNNEFQEIHKLEEELLHQMIENTLLYQKIAAFTPCSFFKSVNAEISGRGYNNLTEYYRYVHNQKREFFKYFMQKTYFSETNYSKVESFIKDDQNVFYSESSLPSAFLRGLLLLSLYILALTLFSYLRLKKLIFQLPDRDEVDTQTRELAIKPADIKVFMVDSSLFSAQLFGYLSGRKHAEPKNTPILKVHEKEFPQTAPLGKKNFLYLCHPDSFPSEIRLRELVLLTARLSGVRVEYTKQLLAETFTGDTFKRQIHRLKRSDKGKLALALLRIKKRDIYLIDDVTAGLPNSADIMLKAVMDQLKTAGSLVLFLTTDDILQRKPLDCGKYFYETSAWSNVVDSRSSHEPKK